MKSRFVILRHYGCPQGEHYDFMLLVGESLKTWALGDYPRDGVAQPAKALPDHRLEYLEYEGPVSSGRGAVSRWDQGECEIEQESSLRQNAVLRGEKLLGEAVLQCDEASKEWTFRFAARRG